MDVFLVFVVVGITMSIADCFTFNKIVLQFFYDNEESHLINVYYFY